jgi:hypothetical protein
MSQADESFTLFPSAVQVVSLILLFSASSIPLAAQQAPAAAEPLVVLGTTLPRGYLHQSYQAKLEAQGGIPPLRWELVEGNLPQGIVSHPEGTLTGLPGVTGEFRFTVNVIDSGKPAMQRRQELVLTVVSPLLVQWGRYPKVIGRRIEGSIIVSNQAEQDFDLTAFIVAAAEDGRATALGYQHFSMKKASSEKEIPFGENLLKGAYQVNVDAVAEVASSNTIYRARLEPGEKFRIEIGP